MSCGKDDGSAFHTWSSNAETSDAEAGVCMACHMLIKVSDDNCWRQFDVMSQVPGCMA